MGIVVGYDCTGANLAAVEKLVSARAQFAGYVTGDNGVVWTPAQLDAHPGIITIDQSVKASTRPYAHVLDIENGAATPDDAPGWFVDARDSYDKNLEPGQRWPTIYCDMENLTAVANKLLAYGITEDGPGLWLAKWNIGEPAAVAQVEAASGPFPVIGIQFQSDQLYDLNIWSELWLTDVSGKQVSVVTDEMPPGQWNDPKAWTWKSVEEKGVGLDGKTYVWTFSPLTGKWIGPTEVSELNAP